MAPNITIRKAETVADYLACQRAQRSAWGINDDSYVVPVATMVGAQHHGGLVLGAFLPDGEAVGLSFAFLGKTGGRLCLYSQLTGVVPGYQDQGIGYRLKTAQRDVARIEDVPCIAWAFDPLQSGNARFNLDKLGATASRYIINMYGPRSDALNRNTPTDRLIAVWETAATAPVDRECITPAQLPQIVDALGAKEGGAGPSFLGVPPEAKAALLEIPDDVKRLREAEPERAERWGKAVRQGFLEAFDRGFEAVGLVREETDSGRRSYYRLERPLPGQDPGRATLAPNGSSDQTS